jgi:hypothetical protein
MPNTQEDLKEIIVNGKVAESNEVTCEKVNGEVAASNEVACVNGEVEAYKNVTSEKVNGEGEEINEVTCEKVNGEVAASNEVTCGGSVREVEERTQDSLKSGTRENLLNLVNSSIAAKRVSTRVKRPTVSKSKDFFMVNNRGFTDRQLDNIDTRSLPWIKPNLNYRLRSGKKLRNFISNDSDKFLDLRIYHQNIRGLRNKTDELLSQWDSQTPHVFCLTAEISRTSINNYYLGSHYCRKTMKNGGVAC